MASFTKDRFGAATVEWSTPDDLFSGLDVEFHFTLDPCATPDNAKCGRFYTREQDGLSQSWAGETVWVNPPYGRSMTKWIEKAQQEAETAEATTVLLIPARTNTRWWADLCMKATEIRFICGRPKFGDADHGLPFPLALVIFRPPSHRRPVIGVHRLASPDLT